MYDSVQHIKQHINVNNNNVNVNINITKHDTLTQFSKVDNSQLSKWLSPHHWVITSEALIKAECDMYLQFWALQWGFYLPLRCATNITEERPALLSVILSDAHQVLIDLNIKIVQSHSCHHLPFSLRCKRHNMTERHSSGSITAKWLETLSSQVRSNWWMP